MHPDDEPIDAPEDVARALDSWRPPGARRGFREELRARFLAAEAEDGEDEAALAPALDAVRTPAARPAFRAALRERFVAGEEDTAGEMEDEVGGRPRLRLLAGGGLIAAAAALVLFWLLPSGAPRWSLLNRESALAGLTVDGEPLPAGTDAAGVAERLASARLVGTGAETVRLVLGELFVIELDPDTTLDLSRLPADLDDDPLVLYGERGGFRIATGPAFDPARRRLEFHTPDVDVAVVGTVFGVDCYPGVTCVCCMEGRVAVAPRIAGYEDGHVEAAHTVLFHGNGDPRQEMVDYEPHQKLLRPLASYWR